MLTAFILLSVVALGVAGLAGYFLATSTGKWDS